MSAHIVFYDTEFTTWEGALERRWSGAGEYREVVQIGAMRIDAATLEPVASFDVLVKPVKNPLVSDYFTALTGITQTAINDNGLDFIDALAQFCDFIGTSPAAAYGNDAGVIRENMGWHGLSAREADFDTPNIGPWFMQHGAAYGVKPGVNSGALARTVGAPITHVVAEHNALEDVRSILAAYKYLLGKGAPKFF